MCGIAGIWKQDGEVGVSELSQMSDSLAHRGPDDSGIFRDGALGLAHRRLSVLDISEGGHQPMTTPDGRFTIVFNGEIFNFRQLGATHLADVAFRSAADTEVLLHLLARYGVESLGWLRGMFSFAFWDQEKKELLLARDPFGKKPLYSMATPGGLYFSSEVKALLTHLPSTSSLAPMAVNMYCSFEYVPAPVTPWKDIRQIEMGTWELWTSPKDRKTQRYWRPHFKPKNNQSEVILRHRLDELLRQSVERRLVADVPVGLLLSGGLDSSTIGWYMREYGPRPLHCFSVAFTEKSFDESRYAKAVAGKLGAEHSVLQFTIETFQEALRELVTVIDMPLADASLLPTYAVSKLARKKVKVVLDGDGSDELFAGYGTFQAAEFAERFIWLKPFFPGLQQVANLVPTRFTDFSFDFKLKSFVRGLGLSPVYRNQVWLGAFTEQELPYLLQSPWYQSGLLEVESERWQEEMRGLSVLDQVSLATIYQYLQNDILVKLDRATMAIGLEARTPFLDIDVAHFALHLPEKYKRNKYLLKKLMADRLPTEIIHRKKKGFGIPLGLWLRGPLYKWGRQVLAPEKLRTDGIFCIDFVDHLWREHRDGRVDHRKKLWTLLTFQLWYDQWIANRSTDRSKPLANHQLK